MKKHEIAATVIAALVTSVYNIVMIRNAVTTIKSIKAQGHVCEETPCEPCEEKEEEKEEA